MENPISESDISTLLIANRGEISSRISRTCRKLGIRSVAVYSEIDRLSPFVKHADMGVCIGENRPGLSYLNQDKIIEAAKKTNADAIHPGYGFLSENHEFAKRCEEEGLIFVGPNPDAIQKMGSKATAKSIMALHGVPVIPGYQETEQSIERLTSEAIKMGFPILLKATAGGGGRGMRIVYDPTSMKKSIESAKREAQNAFGNDRLILEKYIEKGRHIEFQILGDKHGSVVHIHERECSIQRRYQKIIEESPSPIMNTILKERMADAAIKAALALKYDNAGTVEFIYDETSDEFYFLEVNTRLQVEHPVTEEITGLDLVQYQLSSAQGKKLDILQEDIKSKGYAIEVRLYAEDPDNHFMPVTGQIKKLGFPQNIEGLRIESAIQDGTEISIFYDPMIAKIIMWDDTRAGAIRKLNYALRHTICQGIKTNLSFLIKITEDKNFKSGNYTTQFVDQFMSTYKTDPAGSQLEIYAIAATIARWHSRNKARRMLRHIPSGWRNNAYAPQKDVYIIDGEELTLNYNYDNDTFYIQIADKEFKVKSISFRHQLLHLEIDGISHKFSVSESDNQIYVHHTLQGDICLEVKERLPETSTSESEANYKTSMPAQIIKILVQKGQKVQKGEDMFILSSMKMESTITATGEGQIEEIYAKEGQNVGAGFQLLKLKSDVQS